MIGQERAGQIRLMPAAGRWPASMAGAARRPTKLIDLRAKWVEKSPEFIAQVREEWADARPVVAEKLRSRAKKSVDGAWAVVRRPAGAPAATEARVQ